MDQGLRFAKSDERWDEYSENCWDCINLTDLTAHACAVLGECPLDVWNDKESCPHRKLEEAKTP